jgi:hypothetical protein
MKRVLPIIGVLIAGVLGIAILGSASEATLAKLALVAQKQVLPRLKKEAAYVEVIISPIDF